MAHVYPFVPFFRHIFSHKLHHQELLKECLIRRQGFVHVGNEGFGSFLPRDVVHLVCEELGTQNLAWKPKTMYNFGAWWFSGLLYGCVWVPCQIFGGVSSGRVLQKRPACPQIVDVMWSILVLPMLMDIYWCIHPVPLLYPYIHPLYTDPNMCKTPSKPWFVEGVII